MNPLKAFAVLTICLAPNMGNQGTGDLTITFFGHSCFLITTSKGTGIVTDPIDLWGYSISASITAHVVTISHNHGDHNAVHAVPGEPTIFHGLNPAAQAPFQEFIPVHETIRDVTIRNVSSHHSPPDVSPQLNSIFVFEADGISIAHLGDIGRMLTDEQIESLGEIDILMIPIGGRHTISMREVDETVRQINPSIAVIPMHFRTETVQAIPNGIEDFIGGKQNIQRVLGNTITVQKSRSSDRIKYILMNAVANN